MLAEPDVFAPACVLMSRPTDERKFLEMTVLGGFCRFQTAL